VRNFLGHPVNSALFLPWFLVVIDETGYPLAFQHTVTVTVTGTAGVKESLLGLDSWIAAAEEVSLQTASEGGKRRCRRDTMLSLSHCILSSCSKILQ